MLALALSLLSLYALALGLYPALRGRLLALGLGGLASAPIALAAGYSAGTLAGLS